jgi:hypothetical protein
LKREYLEEENEQPLSIKQFEKIFTENRGAFNLANTFAENEALLLAA